MMHKYPNFQLSSNKSPRCDLVNGRRAQIGALIAIIMFQPDNAAHNHSRHFIPRRQATPNQSTGLDVIGVLLRNAWLESDWR